MLGRQISVLDALINNLVGWTDLCAKSNKCPAGTSRLNDVILTSRRHTRQYDVVMTSSACWVASLHSFSLYLVSIPSLAPHPTQQFYVFSSPFTIL